MQQQRCWCGQTGFLVTQHALLVRDGVRLWQYEAACTGCDTIRQFEFRAPAGPAPPYPTFGGPAPSQLLDAGQFLRIATLVADQVPADPADLSTHEVDEAYEAISIAVAAVEEVLKFIPAGHTSVPRDALWETESLVDYDLRPDRFVRRGLMAILGAYRQVQATYSRLAS
jgi:hypothetical protein